MNSDDEPSDNRGTAGLVRAAILRELHSPAGIDDRPAADKMQMVARALVNRAVDGDLNAVKEILDRIDGKAFPAVPDVQQLPQHVRVRWKTSSA
jgi:hypothetical protein